MKAILIMMDTCCRHMLRLYRPEAKASTPNIDRLAERSLVFDNHFIASAPCMPARRDILTGRVNFLERGWGPVEPYDVTLPRILRENGIFTHIVTDHSHYMEIGGEGYLQQYQTWDFQRGQETDVWVSSIRDPGSPEPQLGTVFRQYQCNRTRFHTDADRPTPRTFASAVDWLQQNEGEDNFFLTVEAFDPHEPFDASEEFRAMYPDDFDVFYEWPRYSALNDQETPEAVEHLRNQYCATLSMADKWLGKLLDEIDRQGMWEDTCIIFTSDHGHMLGEHGVTGKNRFHAWDEMCRIPLLVHMPGDFRAGEHIGALTQNTDLFPTLLECFGVDAQIYRTPIHGKSWMPLIKGEAEKIRDYAIYGWFGQPVNITDGRYTYFRAAGKGNAPLNAYMASLTTYERYLGCDTPQVVTCGMYLKQCPIPVYRLQLVQEHEEPPYLDLGISRLYDTLEDPGQLAPIENEALEERLCRELAKQMEAHDAPTEQYERLDLQKYR